MADKLMKILNDDKQNNLLCRLLLVVESLSANQTKFTKVTKDVKPTKESLKTKVLFEFENGLYQSFFLSAVRLIAVRFKG